MANVMRKCEHLIFFAVHGADRICFILSSSTTVVVSATVTDPASHFLWTCPHMWAST